MSTFWADALVVLLIAASLAQLIAVVGLAARRRRRAARFESAARRQGEAQRALERVEALLPAVLQRQEALERAVARLVARSGAPPSRPAQEPGAVRYAPAAEASVAGGVAGDGLEEPIRGALAAITQTLEVTARSGSPDAAAARRAVLGHALKLSAGPAPGIQSTTELVWQLELLGEELARLGADDGPDWSRLCEAVSTMCGNLYGQQLEIFLPGSGEPVHEEFHEISGPGGGTIARALRWGINDTARGCNVLRARVEAG